jgi:hypothetical protein
MRKANPYHSSHLARRFVLAAAVGALSGVVGNACDMGGNEGERCNPLVLRDECNSGLHCTPASCSEAYCCPVNGSSNDPHCHGAGCPDAGDDGGAEGGTDAGDGGEGG